MIYSDRERALIWLGSQDLSGGRKYALYLMANKNALLLMNELPSYRDAIVARFSQEVYDKLRLTADAMYLQSVFVDMDKYGITAVTIESEAYPYLLTEIEPPPLVLFAKGNIRLMNMSNIIAVVGTRNPTRYGTDVTETFVTDLVSHDYIIVSGMARGIDTIAHRTALKFHKNTIAIMGCGLDKVYPAENKALFDQIADCGLLLSEYPVGTPANSYNFPERNRLISGISGGVLVTEAGENSGSLITLNYAVDQCRNIYVVPGSVYNRSCDGSNKALRLFSGCAVINAMDILLDSGKNYDVTSRPSAMQLDYTEEMILNALEKNEMHIEELIRLTGLSINLINPILLKLELLGLIRKLFGNYYGV